MSEREKLLHITYGGITFFDKPLEEMWCEFTGLREEVDDEGNHRIYGEPRAKYVLDEQEAYICPCCGNVVL